MSAENSGSEANSDWKPMSPDMAQQKIIADKVNHLNAQPRQEDVDLANEWSKGLTETPVVGMGKQEGTWGKFKKFFNHEKQNGRTDASTVAKEDHIDIDQAEFRAAGNRQTEQMKGEDSLRRQVMRENPGASADQIEDIMFMKGFKGKESDEVRPDFMNVSQEKVEDIVQEQASETGDKDVDTINGIMDRTARKSEVVDAIAGDAEPPTQTEVEETPEQKQLREKISSQIVEFQNSGQEGGSLTIDLGKYKQLEITFDSEGNAKIVDKNIREFRKADGGNIVDIATQMASAA